MTPLLEDRIWVYLHIHTDIGTIIDPNTYPAHKQFSAVCSYMCSLLIWHYYKNMTSFGILTPQYLHVVAQLFTRAPRSRGHLIAPALPAHDSK